MSLISLLANRFNVDKWLLLANAASHVDLDPNDYHMVHGHVDFGYIRRFRQRSIIPTVLRKPLEQQLSAYSFFRGHAPEFFNRPELTFGPGETQARMRFTELSSKMPLLEFLQQELNIAREQLGNMHTGHLLTVEECADYARNPAAMFEAARGNLASCDVVVLTERLEETLLLLSRRMGWEGLGPLERHNVTRERVLHPEFNPKALEILIEWNQLDIQLNAFAQELFDERLQRLRAGDPSTLAPLPDAAYFTFDQPVHGCGWYQRERSEGAWICWTGAGAAKDAWIDLDAGTRGAHKLSCEIAHVLRQPILYQLRVFVNGWPLPTRQLRPAQNRGFIVEAIVPTSVMSAPSKRTRINSPWRNFYALATSTPG